MFDRVDGCLDATRAGLLNHHTVTSAHSTSCQLCGDTVSVDVSGDILRIVQSDALPTEIADGVLTRALNEIIAASEHRRAIFDVRGDPKRPLRVLSGDLWDWLVSKEASLQRMALVLPDELTLLQANMTALAQSASVRAFTDEADARAWVMRSDRQKRIAPTLPNTLRAQPRAVGSPGTPPSVETEADHPLGDKKR